MLRAVKALSLLAGAAIIAGLLYYYYGPLVVARVYAQRAARGDVLGAARLWDPQSPLARFCEGGVAGLNEFLVSNRCQLGCGLSPFGVTYYRRDRPQFLPGFSTAAHVPCNVLGSGIVEQRLVLVLALTPRGWLIWGFITPAGAYLRLEGGVLQPAW
jgi:hypothetical protein